MGAAAGVAAEKHAALGAAMTLPANTCGNCVHILPTRFGAEWLLCRATAECFALYCRPSAQCAYTPRRFVPVVLTQPRETASA